MPEKQPLPALPSPPFTPPDPPNPQSLAPKTTAQEDIVTAGQRKINLIWEVTQAIVAIVITLATVYIEINGIDSQIMVAGFFLVIGVYLQRTNHQLIGGTGRKATDGHEYQGR